MKKKIASLDLLAVLDELEGYFPAKVEKIYQPGHKNLLSQFYSPDEGNFYLRILSGRAVFLSKKRSEMEFPPHFCMFLRKHLNNARLKEIKQKGFERILEFEFERAGEQKTLIAELFSKGNVILVNEDREIISCLSVQKWKHRTIRSGEKYQYPPSFFLPPLGVQFNLFQEHLEKDEPVKQIAKLGLGGAYAEEIIKRSNYEKGEELSLGRTKDLYKTFKELLNQVQSGKVSPTVYLKGGQPIFYAPFELETFSEFEKREFKTMNQALEFYYEGFKEFKEKKEVEKKVKKKKEKFKRRLENQEEKKKRLLKQIESTKEKGDLIYQNISVIKEVVNGLNKARDKGYEWEEIKKKIKNSEYSREVRKIKEHAGEVILNLDGGVVVDFTLGPNDNAQKYYNKKKKLEGKLEGLKKAIKMTREKMKTVPEEVKQEKREVKRERPERKWYDKFRNFKTSKGKLVLMGKDAQTNEELIEKHLEKNDLVFHAKIKGSPFAVLKNGQESTEEERRQVSVATASYSKAWKKGINSIDTYYVKPDQVSKEAPAGEYLPRGSFMIRGNKEFLTVELELAIGLEIEGKEVKVVSAPETAIQAKHYGLIRPGESSKHEVSGDLKRGLIERVKKEKEELVKQVKRDEIIRVLPAGSAQITKIK